MLQSNRENVVPIEIMINNQLKVSQDDDKEKIMSILQAVWDDDSWQYQH